jgi:hypothetical protein
LFGRGCNDVLFPERNFGSDENFVTDGEFLDSGDQNNLRPGDICVQLGADRVRNCELLGDGGAIKDVLTWLRAILVPTESISFDPPDPQLLVFGPGLPLLQTTEPSSFTSSSELPGGAPEPIAGRAEGEMLYDVSGDGSVTPLDALRIINRMNARTSLTQNLASFAILKFSRATAVV